MPDPLLSPAEVLARLATVDAVPSATAFIVAMGRRGRSRAAAGRASASASGTTNIATDLFCSGGCAGNALLCVAADRERARESHRERERDDRMAAAAEEAKGRAGTDLDELDEEAQRTASSEDVRCSLPRYSL